MVDVVVVGVSHRQRQRNGWSKRMTKKKKYKKTGIKLVNRKNIVKLESMAVDFRNGVLKKKNNAKYANEREQFQAI